MDERYMEWAARWRVPLGFAVAAAYLVLSQPTSALIVIGGGIALAGLALRACAAGYLDKNAALATGGPYAYTRNPLYLGSLMMGGGFAVAGGSWFLGLIFPAFFLAVYWPVMRREEIYLRRQFGEAYERYARDVPLFGLNGRRASGGAVVQFRWDRYRKNREFEAAAGFIAAIAFLVLKMKLR